MQYLLSDVTSYTLGILLEVLALPLYVYMYSLIGHLGLHVGLWSFMAHCNLCNSALTVDAAGP